MTYVSITDWLRKRICRDQTGSLLPLAAVGFIVLAALVGGGLDMSRAYEAKSRLQSACDAAVLAGRRSVTTNGFDNTARTAATSYFNANFNPDRHGAINVAFVPASNDNGNTVSATASADVETLVMAIFNFRTMAVSTQCSASMGVGNSDVTMVLDTTGSMDDSLTSHGPSKLAMLQDAMKDFYDTVNTSVAGGNARVRYAFVPYSSSVNVGHLIYDLNPSYLVNSMTIQSREAVDISVSSTVFDHWADPVRTTSTGESAEWTTTQGLYTSTEYTTRALCTAALPTDTAWTNSGAPTTADNTVTNAQGNRVTTTTDTQRQIRTAYTCIQQTRGSRRNRVTYYARYSTSYARDKFDYTYDTRSPVYATVTTTEFDHYVYKPVVYNVATYKAFASVSTRTGTNGANVNSTWEGCIEERNTTPAASFSFNSVAGITPSSAEDLNIDAAPTSDATRWRPMWPEVAYYRTSFVDIGRGRGRYDLTNSAESLTGGQPPSACPQRAQTLQTMNRSAFFSYADSLIAEGNTYHDIGMLWGARVSSTTGIFASNVNQAPSNGGNVSRHIIFMTDGEMMPSNAVQSSYGIEFHDRRVTANGVNLQSERHTSRFLALCEAVKSRGIRLWVIAFSTGLSDDLETCASDNSAFTANNATELNDAFQEIANEVGELRIVQ